MEANWRQVAKYLKFAKFNQVRAWLNFNPLRIKTSTLRELQVSTLAQSPRFTLKERNSKRGTPHLILLRSWEPWRRLSLKMLQSVPSTHTLKTPRRNLTSLVTHPLLHLAASPLTLPYHQMNCTSRKTIQADLSHLTTGSDLSQESKRKRNPLASTRLTWRSKQ
jgi:hypothetical protein